MRVALTIGLVALPFVTARGLRADLFGWLAFALVLSIAKYLHERRSLRVDARQRDLDRDAASGLHTAQQ